VRVKPIDGADAAAPSGCGLPSAFRLGAQRRTIKRLQRTAGTASTLARPLAADPQPR
jgi:hypothetical protein